MKCPKGMAKAFTQALSIALLHGPAACAPAGSEPESYELDDDTLGDKTLLATYQAEASTSASGCSVATDQAGYTGSGFVDYGRANTWIEWNNVNVATAGRYVMSFRFANGSSDSRTSAVFINGTLLGSVPFNSTGQGWASWRTVSFMVNLRAGYNTVRVIANTSNGGPNLDKLEVSSLIATTPPPSPTSSGVAHIGTTQVWDSDGQDVTIARPSGVQSGDLLLLVLHRTDDDLPLYLDGWTHGAECYKRDNGYDCSTKSDCTIWESNGKFCSYFGSYGGGGHDLAQSVFYKAASSAEPSSYRFNLNMDTYGHPGWAILTALRGAATTDPIRDWAHEGCDNRTDSLFPSVYGEVDDMVLLSQSFDDRVEKDLFGAPSGAITFGYISNSDEAGFLYGKSVLVKGETGTMETIGYGASSCKDALVSMTIKHK
jgi:hypothetical protein